MCMFIPLLLPSPSAYGIPDPVHSLITVRVEPKPSHFGTLDTCISSQAPLSLLWVGVWSVSHLEGQASREWLTQ